MPKIPSRISRTSSCASSTSTVSTTSTQSGKESTHSRSLSFGSTCTVDQQDKKYSLPPLFHLLETLNWKAAENLARSNPEEAKKWAMIRTKSTKDGVAVVSKAKRLPLHHACLKLRCEKGTTLCQKQKAEAACAIWMLVALHPEGAGLRESRHGCLPLHLAAFGSYVPGNRRNGGASPIPSPKPLWKKKSITVGLMPSPRDTPPKNKKKVAKVHFERGSSESSSDGAVPYFFEDGSCAGSAASRSPPLDDEEACLVSIVRALLSAYPKAARVDSEGGRLPLHMACSGRACLGVVQEILAAYPSAARHRTRDGSLPLHLVASWGVSSPEVAVCVLRAYPDAALGHNRHGRSPLEEALYVAGEVGRENQAELVRALRKPPSFWTRPATPVILPPPVRTIGARKSSDRSLNFSLSEDSDEEYPEGQASVNTDPNQSKDESSSTPSPLSPQHTTLLAATTELTILIRSTNWPSVTARLELRPSESKEMLTVTSRSGRTTRFSPLHYALERAPPVEVVDCLIEAHHASLSLASIPGGQLPIHVACTWGASASVVGFLLAANPSGAQCRDEVRNLPIHAACYSGASEEVVESLLCTNPKSVWATNGAGSTPLDIVKRLKHENRYKVIELLKRHTEVNLKGLINGNGEDEDKCTEGVSSPSGHDELMWI